MTKILNQGSALHRTKIVSQPTYMPSTEHMFVGVGIYSEQVQRQCHIRDQGATPTCIC